MARSYLRSPGEPIHRWCNYRRFRSEGVPPLFGGSGRRGLNENGYCTGRQDSNDPVAGKDRESGLTGRFFRESCRPPQISGYGAR